MKGWILKGERRPINTQRQSASNKQDFRFHTGIKTKLSLAILPTRHKVINKTTSAIFNEQGYSLIEIIVVVAVLAGLTSIATTAIQNTALDFENDEIQAHLASVGNECLGAMGKAISTKAYGDRSLNPKEKQGTDNGINAINEALLVKNGYEINSSHTHCPYLQIDPIDADSTTKPSIGFGIFNGKLTKYGIHADDNSDARSACERWAGDKCVDSTADSYNNFFKYMHNVSNIRDTCELTFRNNLTTTPNPPSKTHNRWDISKSEGCNDITPKKNSEAWSKTECTTSSGCAKPAYVLDGKFVGYRNSDYTQAQTLACSNSISTYINSDSYTGGAEEKTDLASCTGTKYICDYSEHNEESYKICKIQDAVSKCRINLEYIRNNKTNGTYVVGKNEHQENPSGSDLKGLPPCGQTVCLTDKVINESACPS